MTTTKQELLIPQNGETAIVQATPMSVLQSAVQQGANVETLAKLLDLQERWEANEARKAFVVALAAFKSNPPKLEKVKHVNFSSKSGGSTVDYHYSPLDYICTEIGASLSKHGLSFTWNVDQTDAARVKVTCILRHEKGHSESVTMAAALHDDQRMNTIQRLGATITYLERYTLKAAVGLAESDQDSDGVTNLEAADFLTLIKESRTIDELKTNFTDAVKEANAKKSYKVVGMYFEARDARQKELAHP